MTEPTEEIRHLPLEARHREMGARFSPFAGYQMPMQYMGIVDEHHAVRESVGLFDVSHMGEVEVRGPDAIAAVDRLITNDASKLVDGQALYSVMCLPDGGIVDDLVLYRLAEDHVLICVNAANRTRDFDHISEHLEGEAEALDRSEAYVQLALQGPRAEELLDELTDLELSELGFFRCARGEVVGVECLVARTGYTGEDGFELYIEIGEEMAGGPPEDTGDLEFGVGGPHVTVFDELMATGTDPGRGLGLQLCGLGARDTLRLEAGLLLYGQDITTETTPLEAGLGWVVALDKERDFIGREALAAQKERGVERRLCGLGVEGRGIIRHGHTIFAADGDEPIGEVTSGSYAPTLERAIGLGYIDIDHCDDETVEVEVRRRRIDARLTSKRFYKRDSS
jgi:aminomethyltransferase